MLSCEENTKQGVKVLRKIKIITEKPSNCYKNPLILNSLTITLLASLVVIILSSIFFTIYQVLDNKLKLKKIKILSLDAPVYIHKSPVLILSPPPTCIQYCWFQLCYIWNHCSNKESHKAFHNSRWNENDIY